MVGPWPHRAFTFRGLSKTYGQMWLRCDVRRPYARLNLAEIRDTSAFDHGSKLIGWTY